MSPSDGAEDARSEYERVGAAYDRNQMLAVRQLTLDALTKVASEIRPGMVEEDAIVKGRDVLKKLGLLRGWHGIKIRFGTNTLKGFSEVSAPGVVLGENDIFFVDIGPVWGKWEGDAGNTFVVGQDPEMHRCKRDVRVLFDRVQSKWQSEALSGRELYDYANAEARRLGWLLNLDTSGHRLSDFPHALLYAGRLSDANFPPTSELWVLEIQIRHPERAFGAFFEDLLMTA